MDLFFPSGEDRSFPILSLPKARDTTSTRNKYICDNKVVHQPAAMVWHSLSLKSSDDSQPVEISPQFT